MKPFAIAILMCCVFTLRLNAQTFPYEFSVLSDPYYDLTAPMSISGADVWDDPFYITSTGFEVNLFNVITNTLGIIAPGSQVINLNEANPDTVQLLIPYMSDIMNANDSMVVSPISYQLEGPPGNAVFKLEWKNVGFYGEWDANYSFYNTTNFQLWVYQNSGIIEFRYGPNTIKSGSLIHFFGTGPLVLLGQNVSFDGTGWEGLWALGGDPQNPVITTIPSGQQPLVDQCLFTEPESGTVYRFAPLTSSLDNNVSASAPVCWPSPARDVLHYSTTRGQQFRIYSMQGQLMLERKATADLEQIDLSSWPTGTYYIQSESQTVNRFTKI